MQISFQREELLRPLSYVASVAERRQTLPILSYVLLRQRDGSTTLTGTDLEVEVIAKADGAAKAEGEMTVPARKLLEICRALPEDSTIEIRKEGEKALVRAGRSRFSLLTMPVADFPAIPAPAWDLSINIGQGELRRLLEATQFCMAQQDVRYYLNGMLWEITTKHLRAIATDGHRMALAELTVKTDLKTAECQVIVPRKAVHEITRLLGTGEERATVQIGANHSCVQTKEVTFITKLIDGRYPEYQKVIPEAQAITVRLKADTLQKALTRVAILSSDKYRGVRLSVQDKTIRITAHNPEQEEAQEELTAEEHTGPGVEIGFNVNYLMDAVNAVGTDEAVFTLHDANSSCTVRPTESKHPLYVIMPMRL